MGETSVSGARATGEHPDALQPWQLFTLAGLIGATIVVFMSRGQTPAGIILLSLIIFAAAYVGLAALRTFLPLAGNLADTGPEILGGRTRAALEREKTLLLRSIKELEFDRGMGKVSEKDFAEMSARLRARAARLMRQLDAGSLYRQQIENEVGRRLSAAGSASRNPAHMVSDDGGVLPQAGQVPATGGAVLAVSEREPVTAGPGPAATRREPETMGPVPGSEREFETAAPGLAATRRDISTVGRVPPGDDHAGGPAMLTCPSCRTANDPDARFCKSCGTQMGQRA